MTPTATLLRFGAFELDCRQEELRRAGVRIKVTPQQLRVLRFLAEHAGEVCSRDEMRREIWGSETFVDFDRGLNVCIAQIRAALKDDSESPRYIQTVPRRGYRFVAPVEAVREVMASTPAATAVPVRVPRALLWAVLAASAAAGLFLWRVNAPVRRVTIAVLPFVNITHQQDDAVLLEGLQDELITQFGSLLPERLGAIGRTSVMRYAGQNVPLARIASELGVAYVVEGDLRREENRERVSLRLIKVADQAQVWNDTYDFGGTSALDFQEQAAAQVSAAVTRALFPQIPPGIRAHRPSPAAYEAFVNGRYLQHNGSLAEFQRVLDWFNRAEKRDPAWSDPPAAIAEEYIALALSGTSPAEGALEQARVAANRAVRIDDGSAEGHNALGSVAVWRDWDFAAARRHFERALWLNPSFAQAHHDYAFLQVITGHPEAGVASLKRALALDPLSARVNVDAGWVLLQAHRFDEAIRQARRALELEPGLREAQACIARAELYLGKQSAAAFFQSDLANPDPYRRALAAAELGHGGEALTFLQVAREQHHLSMPLAATEPAFSALRSDPRFPKL